MRVAYYKTGGGLLETKGGSDGSELTSPLRCVFGIASLTRARGKYLEAFKSEVNAAGTETVQKVGANVFSAKIH